MKKLVFSAFLALMLLAGCISLPEVKPVNITPAPSDWNNFASDVGFQFFYPKKAGFRFKHSDGSIVFATNNRATAFDKVDDYFISITNLSSPSCSSKITGVLETSPLHNTKDRIGWGKAEPVSIFVRPPPLCQPPILNEDEEPDPLQKGSSKFGSAYALCSEKDSKTVVICISQRSDDLELAKQIFETFRWTK